MLVGIVLDMVVVDVMMVRNVADFVDMVVMMNAYHSSSIDTMARLR